MKKIKLMIVDDNEEFINDVKESYFDDETVEIIATAGDGIDAIAKIESFQPDVVILDIVMPKMDGFGVLSNIDYSQFAKKPNFIVVSQLTGENFINKAISLGACYYLVKPLDIATLKDRVKEFGALETVPKKQNSIDDRLIQQAIKKSQHSLDEKLANIFISVGIPAHIKGYQFLREAIKMAIDSPDMINSITKKLYPSIANKFETSPSKVERAIRHAIEVAWNRGKIENINNIFGIKIYTANDKPTNGEFIALLADKMIMEGA
ncbi:MAG: sporulation transcription factor Spo0A [Clostridia bacterium]|jgi:two-component system response regulator (stage 0 sporulation protein A)|nr:sporulation transcription factor Spo0A [Clostridia bacterium]MCI9291534.1 sporulation transcription factor Spo0A [Clostridia bacterium]